MAQQAGCHSMSSLSLNLGWAYLHSHCLLDCESELHWREKEIFLATDFSSVKSSFQVGCDHSAQIVPCLIIMGQKLPASSWLYSTCMHSMCAFFLQSSLFAKLVRFSTFFKICLTFSLPWSIPWFPQGKLVILFSSKPLFLIALPLVHLISCITYIYLHDCFCLLSKGGKLCPI